ncbi:putative amino acid ABC transporter substrate-binding protein [Streptomyces sp. NBRC 110611]|uniref:transporter substrate-binding domain-containing protein n=1 Tax=Streptomyces sp. NBRC 110611 TaxID=1621259 RepID=UPI000829C23B|nr:transporter substrate-binding domain-containing protein [Streptomyces sp. NBRC 110611]GAU69095.1 putative amino acid ABC transporter substrate-binding protein [Streptomyces sp. NBRC 110611]
MSARSALPVIAVATALTVLAGCSATTSAGKKGSGEPELVAAGTLKTCTHLPYAPFQVKKGGKVVGFDVDLVDLVAKDLGVGQEIVNTPFEGIETGQDFTIRKCDLAAAGMTITPARDKVMDFSDPYFDATQALLTKPGRNYRKIEDLKGRKLGYQKATTGGVYAKKHGQGVELVEFEDLGLLLTAVKSGQVEAGINDNGVLLDYVKENPDTAVAAEFDTGERYGFGVRTGNDALRKKINEVLKKARADGSYDRLYKKWFGSAPQS